jgi:hypothetical protein
MDLPSDLSDSPFATLVEADHSRHYGLHLMAEKWGFGGKGNCRAIFNGMGHRSGFPDSLQRFAGPAPQRHRAARQNQTERGCRTDALAASGRRSSKEGGMPVPDDRGNFKQHWCGCSESDEDNRDQHNYQGHDRMHYDAKRAMVCIAVRCMHMRHLDHGQKRKQD